MDLLSPQPFWPIRDGLPAVYPPPEKDLRCEAVVVGAGVSGALVARELTRAGIDTVVLDRRAERCYRRCREAIGELAATVRAEGIACGFTRKNSLLLASNRAHVARPQREYAARAAAGFDVT